MGSSLGVVSLGVTQRRISHRFADGVEAVSVKYRVVAGTEGNRGGRCMDQARNDGWSMTGGAGTQVPWSMRGATRDGHLSPLEIGALGQALASELASMWTQEQSDFVKIGRSVCARLLGLLP